MGLLKILISRKLLATTTTTTTTVSVSVRRMSLIALTLKIACFCSHPHLFQIQMPLDPSQRRKVSILTSYLSSGAYHTPEFNGNSTYLASHEEFQF